MWLGCLITLSQNKITRLALSSSDSQSKSNSNTWYQLFAIHTSTFFAKLAYSIIPFFSNNKDKSHIVLNTIWDLSLLFFCRLEPEGSERFSPKKSRMRSLTSFDCSYVLARILYHFFTQLSLCFFAARSSTFSHSSSRWVINLCFLFSLISKRFSFDFDFRFYLLTFGSILLKSSIFSFLVLFL